MNEANNLQIPTQPAIFYSDCYKLSTDYKQLWSLIQSGQRIPAWLIYTDKYEKPIWDLVEVKFVFGETNNYSIGTRGIGYEGGKTFEWFEAICQKYCLHYVCPQNHDVVGRSEQLKAFADYVQGRMWEDGDKDLSEFVDEFLRL